MSKTYRFRVELHAVVEAKSEEEAVYLIDSTVSALNVCAYVNMCEASLIDEEEGEEEEEDDESPSTV